jgi:MFS family permease
VPAPATLESLIPDLRLPALPGRPRPFYGWTIAIAAAVIAFSSGPGQSYVFSVFLEPIIDETGLTRTAVSALYAVGSGISAVMVSVVSRLADRHGPRRMLLFVAIALGGACLFIASSQGFIMFCIAFAALRALGQGSLPINGTLMVAQWFVRFRGRAVAVMGLGFAASTAILPPLSAALIDGLGWRGAYVVLGIIVWALLIPIALFVVRNRPEDMGLLPDGDPSHRALGTAAPPTPPPVKDERRVFTSLTFWAIALPLAVSPFALTAMVFHQTGIFAEQGLGADAAARAFVPYAIASTPTVIAAGFMVDRFGPRPVFVMAMALLLSTLLFAQVISSPATVVIYGAMMGVSGGMSQIVGGVMWAHVYGRERLGRIQGSGTTIGVAGAALGPLPLAAFQQFTDSFGPGIWAMTALPVFAALTIGLVRPKVKHLGH